MNEKEFRNHLASAMPEVPEGFRAAMHETLAGIVRQEQTAEGTARLWRPKRIVVLAAVLALALATAACAAYHWKLFDVLSFMTGPSPRNAGEVMENNVHIETVNGVEITIREAGYDGRMLFLQYSYRLPDADRPLTAEDEGLLYEHGVGWWIDHIWFDGKPIDMTQGSGGETSGSETPGELIKTEYYRLDRADMDLSGPVEVSLPIGKRQDLSEYRRKEHPEKYDADGNLFLPEKGMVTFTLDARDTLAKVVTEHPFIPAVTDEGTFSVSEVSFTPLMTYIALDAAVHPDVLEAFIAENGEGYRDEQDNLLWPYGGMDVMGGYLTSLTLVDESGAVLFPDHYGNEGYGNDGADYLFPCIETMPDELWLAPVENGQADMSRAVRVK